MPKSTPVSASICALQQGASTEVVTVRINWSSIEGTADIEHRKRIPLPLYRGDRYEFISMDDG